MKEYSLSVDPRILELLGPNLYTNIYYVLAELIANAYDADAKNVYIIAGRDDIRVEDDGHGMSYENKEVDAFLNVAAVSRNNENDAFTRSGLRRKMGRKGVGKLAALSVSEEVDILTVANGEKSGFVLSRRPEEGNKLRAIPDDEVNFKVADNSGTAIVMRNPQYRLHKTLNAVKRNLLKIFPLVNSDFRVHLIRGREQTVIDDFDRNIMGELSTLITVGDNYSYLCDLVEDFYPDNRSKLIESKEIATMPITMKDNQGEEHEYNLEIVGWIGTYKTTRGRKSEMTDFPDNFISLFANKKMGEFNILPVVGQNKLNEVYVIGQIHADLFELSELPDMALSNRQGYKSDDPRYVAVREYVRNELLAGILKKRDLFADLGKKNKKIKKIKAQKGDEDKLRKAIVGFKKKAGEDAAKAIAALRTGVSAEDIEEAISKSINDNSPDIGLKSVVDSQKKKILISQTHSDKSLSDIIYQMLLYNNVPSEDILYTNCDDEVCRVPEGVSVYDYLKDFFVESYSNQMIYVLFVTSENTQTSWGAVTEVGASWITQIDHKIFNIDPFVPGHPLDNAAQWHTTNRDEPTKGDLWMKKPSDDVFCQKIEAVCDALGYTKNSREKNMKHLETLVTIHAT